MGKSDWAKACGAHTQWATSDSVNGHQEWMLRCQCPPCWLAVVGFFAVGPCADSGRPAGIPSQSWYTIRSSQEPGATLSLPWKFYYYSGTFGSCGSGSSTTGTLSLNVGTDTNGKWIALSPIVTGITGLTIYPYLNAFSPDPVPLGTGDLSSFVYPNWCGPPEACIPVYWENGMTAGTTGACEYPNLFTPGQVHLQDLIPILDTLFGTPHPAFSPAGCVPSGTTSGDYYYLGKPQPCATGAGSAFQVCDSPVTQALCLPSANSCVLNGIATANKLVNQHPRYVWTTPAGPLTTDSTFNLVVTAYNPFTGNAIDGTHSAPTYPNNSSEADVDIDPTMDVFPPLIDPDETMQWSSITRVSYGVYQFNNVKFYATAGTRQFEVWGNVQHGGSTPCSPFKIPSNTIVLTAGNAGWVDLPPPNPSFTPVQYKINQTISISGNPVKARVLDRCGQFDVFNVVPTATNAISLILIDDGSNDWNSPTLNGTTTQSAVAGIASFSNLSATALGKNYHLSEQSPPAVGLGQSHNANWHSFPISIVCDLAFETLPTIHAGVATTIKVDIIDANAAVINPPTNDNLTLSGAGSFTGFGTVTPVAGTASFNGNFPAAGTFAIQVVTSGTHYDGPGTGSPTINPVTISVTVLP